MHESKNPSARRRFVTRTMTIGAAAAAVTALPTVRTEQRDAAVASHPKPERGGGYRLSEHVKRYYKTTLV